MESNILFYDDERARYSGRRFSTPVYHSENYYYERPSVHHHHNIPVGEYLYSSPATKPSKSYKKKSPYSKKKPCSCKNSQCLKLYCKCFANGEFCGESCNCKGCHNNSANSIDRSKAIKFALERNPKAFNSKIGVGKNKRNDNVERVHVSGCQCKKSNCMKNYCECYEAKIPCSDRCKCTACLNTENNRESFMCDKFSIMNDWDKSSSYSYDEDSEESFTTPTVYPWLFLTDAVVEAITTNMLLITRASDSEKKDATQIETINNICAEFGNAFSQIFNATRELEASNAVKKETNDVK